MQNQLIVAAFLVLCVLRFPDLFKFVIILGVFFVTAAAIITILLLLSCRSNCVLHSTSGDDLQNEYM